MWHIGDRVPFQQEFSKQRCVKFQAFKTCFGRTIVELAWYRAVPKTWFPVVCSSCMSFGDGLWLYLINSSLEIYGSTHTSVFARRKNIFSSCWISKYSGYFIYSFIALCFAFVVPPHLITVEFQVFPLYCFIFSSLFTNFFNLYLISCEFNCSDFSKLAE